jgi:hypothetical protein
MKKHAIITCCNERYGDFFINDWLTSLKKEVNLKNIDIVLFDYGLNKEQLVKLAKQPIKLITKSTKKHVVNMRFIDTADYLEKNSYDQVLSVDSGDIIFQSDISHLFGKDKTMFRAGILEMEVLFYEVFILGSFDKKIAKKIYEVVNDKPVYNAGFILAPSKKFIELGKVMDKLIKNKGKYGPDQIVLNYMLHQEKTITLNYKYNFMINNTLRKFNIKNGKFYSADNELIPIVHNAGHNNFLRPIKNFGYGKNKNKLDKFMYYFKRYYYSNLKYLKMTASLFVKL